MNEYKLFVAANNIFFDVLDSENKTDVDKVYYETRNTSKINESQYPLKDEFIFDRTDVRAIFITLYTIVFCCCFFGKYSDNLYVYCKFIFISYFFQNVVK